jgi:hypothetical protein
MIPVTGRDDVFLQGGNRCSSEIKAQCARGSLCSQSKLPPIASVIATKLASAAREENSFLTLRRGGPPSREQALTRCRGARLSGDIHAGNEDEGL